GTCVLLNSILMNTAFCGIRGRRCFILRDRGRCVHGFSPKWRTGLGGIQKSTLLYSTVCFLSVMLQRCLLPFPGTTSLIRSSAIIFRRSSMPCCGIRRYFGRALRANKKYSCDGPRHSQVP